jgi:hypothetical protein
MRLGDCDFFRHSAPHELSNDAITHLQSSDAFAHRFDDSRDLASGREGALGLRLILILDDEHIGIVDAARLYRNQHFAALRRGIGDCLEDQCIVSTRALAQQRFHLAPPAFNTPSSRRPQ